MELTPHQRTRAERAAVGCWHAAVCHRLKAHYVLPDSVCRFQVAKGSELYYNPTPLLAATRSDVDGGQPRSAHGQSTGGAAMSPHATRSGGMPQAYGQIPGQGHGPPYGYGANVMQHGPNAGTPYPASAVPAGHFYGNDAGNSSRGSSTMPDGMATPDSRPRRVTRAMTDEFPGHFNH